jgi:putative MATE family efflux protein
MKRLSDVTKIGEGLRLLRNERFLMNVSPVSTGGIFMNENKVLGEGKVGKLLFRYALPCVLSLLISALYNVVDQLFIGNSEIGYMGNVATTIVFPLTILALALSLLVGDGVASFMALCQGKGEAGKSAKAVGAALSFTFALSVVFTVICLLFMDPILRLLGATDNSIALAREYGYIVLGGVIFSFYTNVLNPIIRADGAPIFAMIAQGAGAIFNIIGDPLFIYVFHFGLAGAAYATIIGQALSALLSFVYLRKAKTFPLSWRDFLHGFDTLGVSLRLGISSFFIQISLVAVTVASNLVLVKYGASTVYGSDIPVAVFGIAYKVFTIVVNIPIGIALGGAPIIGYNYGAKKFDRVKKTYNLVILSSLIVTLIATLFFELDPMLIVAMFGSGNAEYEEFAVLCFRVYLSCVILTGAQRTSSVFFQALGKPIQATILSLVRDLVLLVPLTCLLPMAWGMEGFLVSAPIADVLAFALTLGLVVYEYGALNKAQQKEEDVSLEKALSAAEEK